jgi:hypothetical protein
MQVVHCCCHSSIRIVCDGFPGRRIDNPNHASLGMGGKGAVVPDGVGRGYIYDESGILRRCQLTFDGFELEQTCPRGVCLLKSREERVWSWHARAVEGGRRDAVASRPL